MKKQVSRAASVVVGLLLLVVAAVLLVGARPEESGAMERESLSNSVRQGGAAHHRTERSEGASEIKESIARILNAAGGNEASALDHLARTGSPFMDVGGFVAGFDQIQEADLPPEELQQVRIAYLAAYSRRFPNQVCALARRLPEDERQGVLFSMARHSPRLALNEIGNLQDGDNRMNYGKILGEWLRASPYEVAEFANLVRDDAKKKFLIEALVGHLEEVDAAEDAREWKAYLETL